MWYLMLPSSSLCSFPILCAGWAIAKATGAPKEGSQPFLLVRNTVTLPSMTLRDIPGYTRSYGYPSTSRLSFDSYHDPVLSIPVRILIVRKRKGGD